jgi:hypothetical protein
VSILKDKQTPQLEGQIMILKFGRKIANIIQNYFGARANLPNRLLFENSFELNVFLTMGFPNYEKCHFTDTSINIVNKNLDLNQELQFRTINLISLQRKEKLEQLKNNKERNYDEIFRKSQNFLI